MRIFLTGGTGYIGQRLAARLADEGHAVRALVRPTSDVAPLSRPGIETFVGDLGDRASMRLGMSGSDWVIHAAAELDSAAPSERMRAANVEGSENVASLAFKLGVGRLLSISSIAYFGGSPDDGSPADESARPREPFPTRYSATKNAGERAIRAWERRGLKVNTVYPSLVYGPPGKKGGGNGILRLLLKRRIAAYVGADRRASWIFLDDLVDGICKVVEKAPPGRDYLMAGEAASFRELATRVCALGNVRPPRFELPLSVARLLVTLMAPLFELRGRRPPFTVEQLESLRRHWVFDDARARTELGWQPRGLDAGLPPTVDYLLGR